MADRVHLVLVPGLLSTEALFQAQVSGLAHVADVTVTRQHLRHDTVEEMAAAILTESPPKFAIAGSSMGGYVALMVKKVGGQRVTHLGLLDSTAIVQGEELEIRRQMLLELAERGAFDAIKEQMLQLFLQPDNLKNQALLRTVNDMADGVGVERFAQQVRALSAAENLDKFLPQIDCPTLVLCGEDDKLLPLEQSRSLMRAIKKSRLAVIGNAAHLITLERPETVNELMRQWLTGTLAMDQQEMSV